MTDLATTEAIIPEGYDPNGPDACRENYARALADEAQKLYSKVERFYVIFATIRDQQLFKLLGYLTIQDFALGEYGVSPATAQRWVVTGRAIAEIDSGESTNGVVEFGRAATHSGTPTVPLQRVTDEARLSQREAARLAKIKREQEEAEATREAREARIAAMEAAKAAKEAKRKEIEEGPILVAQPVRPRAVLPERVPRVNARDVINRILAVIDTVDDARVVASVATASEKAQIVAFAAHFAPRRVNSEEVMSEKDCAPHPVGRRLGKDCGRCGAKGVWK